MDVLRFFLTLTSVPDLRRAQARHRIRVLIQSQQPLSRPSPDTRAVLCSTARTTNLTFSRSLTKLLRPKLPRKRLGAASFTNPKRPLRGVSDQG
jgi:hypothetical protein